MNQKMLHRLLKLFLFQYHLQTNQGTGKATWRERAIASERIRLAMGLSLRPSDHAVHMTSGFEESNITEKYYEPPLMQVIPSACDMM